VGIAEEPGQVGFCRCLSELVFGHLLDDAVELAGCPNRLGIRDGFAAAARFCRLVDEAGTD
jgi:hypothetical protein